MVIVSGFLVLLLGFQTCVFSVSVMAYWFKVTLYLEGHTVPNEIISKVHL